MKAPAKFIHRRSGFTLVELLAAMVILVMIVGLLFSAFSQASKAWMQSENRVETYSNARAALDFMSKELTQALVNSNLQFTGTATSLDFFAPVSIDVSDGSDLIEVHYSLDAANNLIRTSTAKVSGSNNVAVLAMNISPPLSFHFADTNSVNVSLTSWDSTAHGYRAPTAVQIFLTVIDSRTAARIKAAPSSINSITNQTAQTFSTEVYIPNRNP